MNDLQLLRCNTKILCVRQKQCHGLATCSNLVKVKQSAYLFNCIHGRKVAIDWKWCKECCYGCQKNNPPDLGWWKYRVRLFGSLFQRSFFQIWFIAYEVHRCDTLPICQTLLVMFFGIWSIKWYADNGAIGITITVIVHKSACRILSSQCTCWCAWRAIMFCHDRQVLFCTFFLNVQKTGLFIHMWIPMSCFLDSMITFPLSSFHKTNTNAEKLLADPPR